jgi:hypothetical protein
MWPKSRSGRVTVPRPGSAAFFMSVCLFFLILGAVVLTTHQRVPPETTETDSELSAEQELLLSSLANQEAAHDSGLLKNIKHSSLVWHARFNEESGHECLLFIFDFGGAESSPITVVITDASRTLLTWKEVGGEPLFTSATFEGNLVATFWLSRMTIM